MKTYKNIDEYIKNTPKEFTPKVKEIRSICKKLIPKGIETIKYGIPTIQLDGKNFIHFAAMKSHLGFYPTPSGVKAFENELKKKGIKRTEQEIKSLMNKENKQDKEPEF